MVIWKDIEEFDNLYSVSNTGLIRNNKTSKVLKQTTTQNGYSMVVVKPFGRTGKCKAFKIHREVAKLFVDNPDNKPTVNHKDGNKLNNLASNLEWATSSEQMTHAHENKLVALVTGERNKFSRLTDEQAKEILDNPQIRNIEFARRFNIDRSAISKLRSGKHWKHLRAV